MSAAATATTMSVNDIIDLAAAVPSSSPRFSMDALPTRGSGLQKRGLGHTLFNPYDVNVKTTDATRDGKGASGRGSGAENAYGASSCLGLTARDGRSYGGARGDSPWITPRAYSADLATKAQKLRDDNPYARGPGFTAAPVGHSKWSSASKEYQQALR